MALFGEKPLIWVTCLFFFFRDPETFKFGELRNPIDLWGKNLKGLEMSKDVLEWLEHGVDIKIHKTF